MIDPRQVAVKLFGEIAWKTETAGFMQCPGHDLHQNKNGKRDCRITLDGAPTIYCFHDSCSSVLADANYQLRVALAGAGDGAMVPGVVLSAKERHKIELQMREKRLLERIPPAAREALGLIMAKYACTIDYIIEQSPCKVHPKDNTWQEKFAFSHWLNLWDADDIIWLGGVQDSGQKKNAANFIRCDDVKGPAEFTTASCYQPETFSRANENVVRQPFMVLESDSLQNDKFLPVINFLMRSGWRLRCLLHSGGKSYHAWFDYPEAETLVKILKIVLKEFGCDPKVWKPSQPVRCPGWRRDNGNLQKLFYLDYNI